MRDVDLEHELSAAHGALTAEHRAELSGAGIPEIIVALGFVGAARIALDQAGRRYQPVDDGARAFVTPVRVGEDPVSPEHPDFELVPQYGDLIDLVAWSPAYPDNWATRRGVSTWLGAIEPQFMIPPPVAIRRSVLSWLRAGATGLCLLPDDPLDAYRALIICEAIEAEDRAHARELRRIIERPLKGPIVAVARRRQARAA